MTQLLTNSFAFGQAALSQTGLAVSYWDRQQYCRFANHACETWLHVGADQLVGLSLSDVMRVDMQEPQTAAAARALDGKATMVDFAAACPDGVVKTAVAHYLPEVVKGEVQGFVLHIVESASQLDTESLLRHESSDNRRTHELLRKSEAALRHAQRIGQIGSWEWEIATDITSWSEQLYVMFGLDPSHLPPTYAQHGRLYTAESWDKLQAAVSRALATGEPYTLELKYCHASGRTGWIEARGAVARDEAGQIVALQGTAHEITARRKTASLFGTQHKLDAEIAKNSQLEKSLTQAKRLEVLGLLAGGIAHDFNNVLAAVSGSLHLLKRTAKDDRSQTLVDRGLRGVDRATRLVRQLMGFARTQALEVKTVDLSQELQNCIELLQLSAGPQVRVSVTPSSSCLVLVDANQFEVALINLVINARDAMPQGGEIVISVDATQVGRAAICIRDTGCGMPPDVLARAREPFFTTKPLGQGTGLGLAMVNAFAQQSGGTLELESQPGNGCSITIVLPRSTIPASTPMDQEDKSIAWNRHGNAVVLVVDDDALVRPTVVQYLRDLLYTVVEAESGQQALELAILSAPDLVITDITMHGMDGVALAAQLRQLHPNLPILMMTGQTDRTGLSGEEVLDKPFTQAVLAERVLRLLGRTPPAHLRLAGRIKHPALRALYQSWHEHRSGDALPSVPSLNLPRCAAPENVFVGEVVDLLPFTVKRTFVGKTLTELVGYAALGSLVSSNEEHAFAGLEAAYRRCMRLREPSYEYMRFQLEDGASTLFERLLLPCVDTGSSTHYLVGMVFFETLQKK
jgi:PAS domain S-box-containing protein